MGRLKKHNKKGGAQCPVFVFACRKGRRQVFESVFFLYSLYSMGFKDIRDQPTLGSFARKRASSSSVGM